MLKDPKQQKIKCSIFYYKAILPTSLEETLCYSPLPHHLGKVTASNMLLPHEVFYFYEKNNKKIQGQDFC